MGPGFRYHVATLTGIFLALGLGIMVGSTFVKGAIIDSQAKALAALRDRIDKEIEPRRVEKERNDRFVAALGPWLLEGKLAGKHVALIQTGDYSDVVRRIREALETAGATVSSVTTIDQTFPTRAQTNLAALLPKLRATRPDLPAEPSALLSVVAQDISRGSANAEQELRLLEDARLIRADGEYKAPNDCAVLVGGASLENESRAESLDLPLINLLRAEGKTVVEAEPESAAISYIPTLKSTDISTVDNADSDIGRIAVVLALLGDKGNFGVRPTAGSILPTPSSDDLRRSPGP